MALDLELPVNNRLYFYKLYVLYTQFSLLTVGPTNICVQLLTRTIVWTGNVFVTCISDGCEYTPAGHTCALHVYISETSCILIKGGRFLSSNPPFRNESVPVIKA